MQGKTAKKVSLVIGVLAIAGMGTVTVACSPRTEKPAETSVPSPDVNPTEKVNRTNVTRGPISVAPNNGGGGGNPAVPCGFGPRGGGPCGNNG